MTKKIAVKAKKPIKSRFTIMVGTAMDGFKFKPVVIGKSQNPRCFKDVNRDELPVYYYSSKNAWMTREIFWDWFLDHFIYEVNEHYGEDTTVHLLLDNCAEHLPKEQLDEMFPNIQIWMLPPNTTALIQPMDQGVIMVLKSKFKSCYYKKLVEYTMDNRQIFLKVDPFTEFLKTYSILDAIYNIDKAWQSIDSVLI